MHARFEWKFRTSLKLTKSRRREEKLKFNVRFVVADGMGEMAYVKVK